jgi:hypothetical protein
VLLPDLPLLMRNTFHPEPAVVAMKIPRRKLLLAVAAAALLAAFVPWWLTGPRRAILGFVGDLTHARYVEAAARLSAPSALVRQADGSLSITDRRGNQVVVPAADLPFVVSGDGRVPSPFERLRGPAEVKLMAFGEAVAGVLLSPARTLVVRVDGTAVTVDHIE